MVVSPWGEVLAEAGEDPQILLADIDLGLCGRNRAKIPSLKHGREFEVEIGGEVAAPKRGRHDPLRIDCARKDMGSRPGSARPTPMTSRLEAHAIRLPGLRQRAGEEARRWRPMWRSGAQRHPRHRRRSNQDIGRTAVRVVDRFTVHGDVHHVQLVRTLRAEFLRETRDVYAFVIVKGSGSSYTTCTRTNDFAPW